MCENVRNMCLFMWTGGTGGGHSYHSRRGDRDSPKIRGFYAARGVIYRIFINMGIKFFILGRVLQY